MRKLVLALIGVVLISVQGRSQTYVCYSDTTKSFTLEWAEPGCSFVEKTGNDAFEGTKYLEYSYSQNSYIVHYPEKWKQIDKRFDASKYKYLQFACKIDKEKASADQISFWCIHCDPNNPTGDVHFNGKFDFKSTTSWKVITVPMSTYAKDAVNMISSFKFIFTGSDGARKFDVDKIVFTNDTNAVVSVKPSAPRNMVANVIFPKAGKIKIDTYSLNGVLVASRIVDVAANTAFQASRYAAKNLPAGAYVVRQRVLNGATEVILDAGRLVVEKK
jgi:hypothetical protein